MNNQVSRWELADLKNFVEIYNENETKLTKILFSFPGLLQPFSKKKKKNRTKKREKKNKTSNFKRNQAYQVRGGNTKCKLPYKIDNINIQQNMN